MASFKYIISKEFAGMNVKTYLRKEIGISSRVLIALKKEYMGITINGKHCRSVDILNFGDELSISLNDLQTEYECSVYPVEVVYEDKNFLIVNKPFSMPMYKAGVAKENLHSAVAGYFKRKNENVVYRPLYRLDRDTSGLVIIAKNAIVAASTEINKVYYAVCHGSVKESGVVNSPISVEEGSFIKRITGVGERAVTNYFPLKCDTDYSYVRFILETGRTHQIRVHMASVGHPLAGDDLYGGSIKLIGRQALYCGEVNLECKPAKLSLDLKIPVPEDILIAFPSLFNE